MVYFVNHRYKTSTFIKPSSSDHVIPLSSHDSTLLNHCRYLTIKITQTQGAAIPVIGSLKVIAYPHTSAYIRQPMPSVDSRSGHVRPPTIPKQEHIKSSDDREPPNHSSDDDIPKEFVDPLTYEMMSLPIILPSGYVIDQTTLNKHIDMEKSWGRNASDPFTGILLNSSNQPMVKHKMKERIDKYALLNDIAIGRTSGWRKRDTGQHSPTSCKRIRQETSYLPTSNHTSQYTSACSTSSSTEGEGQTRKHSSDIGDRVSKLLKKTSTMRTVTIPATNNRDNSCVKCQQQEPIVSYKLVCNHLICKICLTEQTDGLLIKCARCQQETRKSLIERFHPS